MLTVLATALQAVFIAFAARHVAFALSAVRAVPADLVAPVPESGYRPTVSVLVPCRDEEVVLPRLLDGLLALDYPAELLQWVVVDDGSHDRTGEVLDAHAAVDHRLEVLHRPDGAGGGKSGALNAGLGLCTGEIVVIFDADHRPRPDVVARLVRHFADPVVAAVQGRCEIRNPGDSAITRLIAIDYMGGYLVNEYGRQSLHELPAYGGANCAVRTETLRSIGGWNAASVTEDTDLTVRLVLLGHKVRYDVSAVDEEEGVVTFGRYWSQRYRWARGHQQVWRDYRGAVLSSPHLSVTGKAETMMFLLAFHLPVLSTLGLVVLGLWTAGVSHGVDPLQAFTLWTILFLGPLIELGSGLLIRKADRRDAFALVLFVPMFFVFMVICTKAWLDGIAGRSYSWVKTRRAADSGSATRRELGQPRPGGRQPQPERVP